MIYLDHGATSFPKLEEVYRGMEAFVRASGANPGRGGFWHGSSAAGVWSASSSAITPLTD